MQVSPSGMASASQADFGGSVHSSAEGPACWKRQTPVTMGDSNNKMQVSPSGMASASQADFGGSDSRHLLQKQQVYCCLLSKRQVQKCLPLLKL